MANSLVIEAGLGDRLLIFWHVGTLCAGVDLVLHVRVCHLYFVLCTFCLLLGDALFCFCLVSW